MNAGARQILHVTEQAMIKIDSNGDRRTSIAAEESAARANDSTAAGARPRVFVAAENRLLREALSRMLVKSGEIDGQGARAFGGPAISPDGKYVAFSVRQHGQTLLYGMQADGTNARIVTDSLDLQGAPAWAPDGQSLTSAADDHGVPHLFRVPVDGRSPAPLVQEYSVDPAWAPDGRFVVYSGPDIGTTFSV
jgi:Tol biopolymer transport system component